MNYSALFFYQHIEFPSNHHSLSLTDQPTESSAAEMIGVFDLALKKINNNFDNSSFMAFEREKFTFLRILKYLRFSISIHYI